MEGTREEPPRFVQDRGGFFTADSHYKPRLFRPVGSAVSRPGRYRAGGAGRSRSSLRCFRLKALGLEILNHRGVEELGDIGSAEPHTGFNPILPLFRPLQHLRTNVRRLATELASVCTCSSRAKSIKPRTVWTSRIKLTQIQSCYDTSV